MDGFKIKGPKSFTNRVARKLLLQAVNQEALSCQLQRGTA